MKNLVVYYTWKGNTEVVAREIADAVGGALHRIEEVKPPTPAGLGWAAFSALIGRKSRLKPLDSSLTDVERLFIGGPVWAGHSTPAINAFLATMDFTGKTVYLFTTQADEKEPDAVLQSIASRVKKRGGQVAGRFFVQSVMGSVLSPETVRPQVTAWARKIIPGAQPLNKA